MPRDSDMLLQFPGLAGTVCRNTKWEQLLVTKLRTSAKCSIANGVDN